MVGLCLAFTAIFLALGGWQVQRRAWKLDLIARVEQRIHSEPSPPPGPDRWAGVTQASDGYRRLRLTGRFRHDRETLVQAVTNEGPGFWVLTPLSTDQGFDVLVNRGFVTAERRAPGARLAAQVDGPVSVVGLLRLTEPHGGFLRKNAPTENRWYSRDVAAIGQARGLSNLAPYFVDADAAPNPGGWPIGGLTVVKFPNSHLVYMLTWFGLALLTGGAAAYVLFDARRNRVKETP
ncbi:SURF1 family protein [Caulobacter sp. 602-2]|uniref:SURF1-like protein n=1 Tax=Caulobacter sp. 602-2 TaxID=2710887 RepID=A0A6G4QSP2_9CAUL|nr:SURF1 family protein [Caulobacter sp. 602-2]NGM48459.1 SURF1 family protein [Caulobacter sp. 602-2]